MRDGMRKSRLSKVKQDRLIEHFVAGTTARCAAALVGVNRKTAAYYFIAYVRSSPITLSRMAKWLSAARSKWMKPISAVAAKESGAVVLREKSRFSVC